MKKNLTYSLILIFIGLVLRIISYAHLTPLISPDSISYIDTGKALFGGEFSNYNGNRPLVYPLILFVFDYNIQAIVGFQMLLGIIQGLIIFNIFRRLAKKEGLGFIAALLYMVNPSQILLENSILAETMLTILISISYLLLIRLLENRKSLPLSIFLAIVTSVAVLTKPQVVFLPFLLIALFGIHYFLKDRSIRRCVAGCSFALITVLLLLLSWSYFNYRTIGYFDFSTIGGYALIMHCYPFIEKAPDKYKEIRKIYVRHRDLQYEKQGRRNPITLGQDVRNESMEKLNLSYTQLGYLLKEVAIDLIIHNPTSYLKSVFFSFIRYWYPTWYSSRGGIRTYLKTGEFHYAFIALSYALLLFYATAVFFLAPVFYFLSVNLRKYLLFDYRVLILYLLTVVAGTFQALAVNATESARYRMPFEPFIFGIAVMITYSLWKYLRERMVYKKNIP